MPIPEVFGDSGLIKPGGVIDMAASVYGGINPIFGNIYAGVKNAAAMKAQEQLANDFASKNESLFNNTYNRDYLETNAASGMLERMRKRMQESNATIDKQAATTGATNENVLAAKSKETEKYNEGAAQIAAQGTASQDQALGRYQSMLPKVFDAQNNVLSAKIQAAQTQAANSGSTLRTILGAIPSVGGGSILEQQSLPSVDSGVLAGRAPNAVLPDAGEMAPRARNDISMSPLQSKSVNFVKESGLNMNPIQSKPAFAVNSGGNPINSSVLSQTTTPITGGVLTSTDLMGEMPWESMQAKNPFVISGQ